MNRRERELCLGFVAATGLAARVGVRSLDGSQVDPLPVEPRRKLTFITPHRSAHDSGKTGVSLLLLEQAAHYMEGELARNFNDMNERGKAAESAAVRLIPDVFGAPTPPDSILPQDVLSLIAATLAANAFFVIKIFGGPESMHELVAAFNYLNEKLGVEMHAADGLASDLEVLAGILPSEWTDEHARAQQQATAMLVALLRNMKRRALALPTV